MSGSRQDTLREIDKKMLEVDTFSGESRCEIAGKKTQTDIIFDRYSIAERRAIQAQNFMNVVYLAPNEHITESVFSRIVANDAYKAVCLKILQLFDAGIVDLILLKNEENNLPMEYVKHEKLGNTPLLTYGDGIKKILSLANALAKATGGILLIDEIETAIHKKYYQEFFRFLQKAALNFDVQLFITTHNIEAIDAWLTVQNYNDEKYENDDLSVLTFKKDQAGKHYSRTLTGKKVFENREQFTFEVRL